MKKLILIAIIGTVFAATGAFACDTCKAHAKKADGQEMACPANCEKACEAKKTACAEGCDKASCAKKEACAANCDKPCCAKADTATKTEGTAPCCASMLGKPA